MLEIPGPILYVMNLERAGDGWWLEHCVHNVCDRVKKNSMFSYVSSRRAVTKWWLGVRRPLRTVARAARDPRPRGRPHHRVKWSPLPSIPTRRRRAERPSRRLLPLWLTWPRPAPSPLTIAHISSSIKRWRWLDSFILSPTGSHRPPSTLPVSFCLFPFIFFLPLKFLFHSHHRRRQRNFLFIYLFISSIKKTRIDGFRENVKIIDFQHVSLNSIAFLFLLLHNLFTILGWASLSLSFSAFYLLFTRLTRRPIKMTIH